MSLEARIAELNDTNKALISVLQQFLQLHGATGVITEPKATTEKKSSQSENSSDKPTKSPAASSGADKAGADTAPPATTTSKTAAPAADADTPADTPAVTLDDCIAVTRAAGKAGIRDVLAATLGKFGAAKATELKPEHYAAYHAAISKALEA